MSKRKLWWIILAVMVLTIGVLLAVRCSSQASGRSYKVETLSRGNVFNTISCSGTLEAVGTVEVGTQVSAMLDHIYADFNDDVKKGQILALLDTVMLTAQVVEAQSSYQKVEALLEQAQSEYDRNLPLYKKGYISEAEFLPYKINLKTQHASLKSAGASVIKVERNLKYAVIRSPIDGTVIQRNVEEGQTVAASLAAPTLFVIAEDLSKMEIHALVDESDIGQIKEGQRVVFEVQAYADREFSGTVRQVRLQPEVVSNVVNYTVVVDAQNDGNLLLPGMTATIDFYVEEKNNVLLLPKNALRFSPTDEMLEKFHKKRMKEIQAVPDSLRPPRLFRESGSMPEGFEQPDDMGLVWYLAEDGTAEAEPVRTGVTDGKMVEIVSSRMIKEGSRIISGWSDDSKSTQSSSSQNQNRRPMGRPPMF